MLAEDTGQEYDYVDYIIQQVETLEVLLLQQPLPVATDEGNGCHRTVGERARCMQGRHVREPSCHCCCAVPGFHRVPDFHAAAERG